MVVKNLLPPTALSTAIHTSNTRHKQSYIWEALEGLAFESAWPALLGLSYLGIQTGHVEPKGLLVAGC